MRPSFTAILAGISVLLAVSLSTAQDSGSEIASLIEAADSLHRISQLDSALALAKEALVMARTEYRDSDTLVARVVYTLAQIHGTKAEYSLADSLFAEAMKIYEEILGPDHYIIADILKHIATLAKDQGEYEQSEQLYLKAIAIYRKADEKDRIHLGAALKSLAEVFHEQGKFVEA